MVPTIIFSLKLIVFPKNIGPKISDFIIFYNSGPFGNWNIFDKMILTCHFQELAVDWTIMSWSLVLNPIDVTQFLQIFKQNAFLIFITACT
jgi:hypothetical protein